MPGKWSVHMLHAHHCECNSVTCSHRLFGKIKVIQKLRKAHLKAKTIKSSLLANKTTSSTHAVWVARCSAVPGWPHCSRQDIPLFPPHLVLLAFQIARPVYLNEVDKDVQNSIVCSLCSAPEETQSTSLSVLADVTYILWFHLGIITPLPLTASAHALFKRPQASIIHPALAWNHEKPNGDIRNFPSSYLTMNRCRLYFFFLCNASVVTLNLSPLLPTPSR